METQLPKEVQQRLDKINWDSLKEKYGISKESVTQNPTIASQLAYGQMTDLVYGSNAEITGQFSLRAYPKGDKGEWAVKVYTIEKSKTAKDNITVYNQPITSEKVKETLFERTTWTDQHGVKKSGLANANGGRPITLQLDGRRQECLVSVHQPTNRIVVMPVDQVRSFFYDKDGALRGKSLYGVKFTKDQVNGLIEGRAVVISGLRKDGTSFSCCAQFDAAQRQVVPCHPKWFQEATRAGMDIGKGQEQGQTNAKTQDQKESKGQSAKSGKQDAPKQSAKVRMK
jgi:hypothetical protein